MWIGENAASLPPDWNKTALSFLLTDKSPYRKLEYQNRSFSGLRPGISNYFARTRKTSPTPIMRRANPNITKTSFPRCCVLD